MASVQWATGTMKESERPWFTRYNFSALVQRMQQTLGAMHSLRKASATNESVLALPLRFFPAFFNCMICQEPCAEVVSAMVVLALGGSSYATRKAQTIERWSHCHPFHECTPASTDLPLCQIGPHSHQGGQHGVYAGRV